MKNFSVLLVLLVLLSSCSNPFQKSDDSKMAGVTLSNGTLSPSFSPDVLAYTVVLESNVTNVTISGRTAHEKASITAPVQVADVGFSSSSRANLIVTAEDGSITLYAFTVTRAHYTADATINLPDSSWKIDEVVNNGNIIKGDIISEGYSSTYTDVTTVGKFLIVQFTVVNTGNLELSIDSSLADYYMYLLIGGSKYNPINGDLFGQYVYNNKKIVKPMWSDKIQPKMSKTYHYVFELPANTLSTGTLVIRENTFFDDIRSAMIDITLP